MGECCEEKCCEAKECCSESCNESSCEESKGDMMMNIANEAWEELMKEKMKSAYEKSIGDKMNRTAMVAVEACIAYWGNKMKEKAACAEFEEKLKKAMM